MPDYTKQLDEIVRILNRPATPAWLIAALSAVLGVIGAMVGRVFQMALSDWYKRRKMRRIVYGDIADMYLAVSSIMSFKEIPQPQIFQWREQELRKFLRFKGEKYIQDNSDIFMELSERHAVETIYMNFHQILDDIESMHLNANFALRRVEAYVRDGGLRMKYIKKYLPAFLVKRLQEMLKQPADQPSATE